MDRSSDDQRIQVSVVRGTMVASLQVEPLIATLQHLREDLLEHAARDRLRGAVLDLSGISGLDGDVMTHLKATMDMLQLMGVSCRLAGIRPGLAAALCLLSSEWSSLPCDLNVDMALRHFDAPHGR